MLHNHELPTPNRQLPNTSAWGIGNWQLGVDGTLTVQSVEESGGFESLRPQWNELLRASGSDNPFLTWEWLHAWWVQLGALSGLRLIVVRSGHELIGIAPLRLASASRYWFSHLEFLGTGHAGSDYLDLIVRLGWEAESVSAIARYLTAQRLALRLTHLPPTSLGAQLAECLAAAGWISSRAEDGSCPVIPLEGHTFDSYLGTLGSSHRANFRRRLKALGQQFEVRFDRVTAEPGRRRMLAALVAFHARRWNDRGGSTAFATPAVRSFQDDATRRALEHGWLRMYVLRLNGDAAAVMYGFNYGGRFYFYQHGFDDRYKAHSVGLVLMGLTICAAI
jgi:CelD/BcsL family acetyltransferase involved in cellulose biosynthesis